MHVQCRHIHFCYPGTNVQLFKDLTFEINEPGLHAIFGPSGVGKSSLAQMIAGRMQPDDGQVRLNGAGAIFYTYNMERLPGWSSVGRHLERITPAHNDSRKAELLEAFGLTSLLKQRFSQLSLGQQNRVNLVRYLLQDFKALIMDESLANVDERMRSRILLKIKALFPDVLFIYISHNVVEVATFCRRIWVLRSIHRSPQTVLINGQDRLSDQEPDLQAMQRTMLEVMNAA